MLKTTAIALVAFVAIASAGQVTAMAAKWTRLPDLPDPLGVAGPFVGESGGAVIVAGGANFPDAPPWRGGHKACSDALHVLTRNPNSPEKFQWIANAAKLPHAAAYGVSITTPRGVLLIGGCDAKQCYADVRRARWSRQAGVVFESLPPLPRPLAYMTGASAGDTVFVAGGQESVDDPRATSHLYTLDLSREGKDDFAWRERSAISGPPRIVPVSAASGATFYLFSGRDVQPGALPRPLTDAYRFDLASDHWETLPAIQPKDATAPRCVMAGGAIVTDDNLILLLGGDPGGLFLTIENVRREIAAASDDPRRKQSLQRELGLMLDTHPGFTNDVIRFDPASRTYTRCAVALPTPPPVTTTPIRAWDARQVLIVSGEIRPAVRTPVVWLLVDPLGAGGLAGR